MNDHTHVLSDLLHPGDVIHEINGKSIQGYTVDDVADLMVRNRNLIAIYQCRLSMLCQ